jgi:hypothetical protein
MSKPFSNLSYRFLALPLLMVVGLAAVLPASAQTQQATPQSHDPLAEILLRKGILTPDDMKQIERATTPQQAEELMARILLDKGVLSKGEYEQVTGTPPAAEPVRGALAPAVQAREVAPSASTRPAAARPPATAQQASSMQAPSAAANTIAKTEKPAPPVIDALAPIRLLPVGGAPSSTPEPAFKAEGVGVTPYGFVRATAIEDSSDPTGDDFPLPGFLSDTPPDGSPEFHLKARSTRFGLNFNVLDSNPKWVITGRVEADFEGNFNRSDNRNLSSIRSSNPSLRVAWGRLDYHFDDRNTFSALAGQDWTIFTSSTLANIVEVTGIGIGFGGLWERDPQMRVGYTHKFGGFSIMPEFAIDLPGSGLPPSAANVSEQLGYGERQGPDSNRPEIQGRLVGQWQLDHAAGVAPAQIIFSGFSGKRTANVLASSVPAIYQAAFPKGLSASSKQDGWDGEWQLPARWFTLTGKVYSGADLRWFFGGQLYSFFCDTHGLTNTVTVASEDGASNVVLGTNASGQPVVAPERPIRAAGGFAQLGLPLSRIFNANPRGRNSGWSIYALYGVDQAKVRDVNRLNAASRHASTMAVGTLNYKLNKWMMFSFDESLFTTHANPEEPLPLYRGVPSREWKDLREEFGPTFTF